MLGGSEKSTLTPLNSMRTSVTKMDQSAAVIVSPLPSPKEVFVGDVQYGESYCRSVDDAAVATASSHGGAHDPARTVTQSSAEATHAA